MAPRKRTGRRGRSGRQPVDRDRSGGRIGLAELATRVAALEERLARIESGRAPPGDGRAAAEPRRAAVRCPGCGLTLRRRAGRCAACGRPIDSL